MQNYTSSEENYIKSIYHLQQSAELVGTNELADHLQAKPASITDMLKKLKTRKLIHYQPYKGFRLTQQGKKVALGIIRRHRLWEYFLSKKLKFKWNEVHDVAEQLEHVSSKKLVDKLDEFLDFPKFDPHGDPIPDVHGRIEHHTQIPLTEWPLNEPGIVCQVLNQSVELLELLQEKEISIGSAITVKRKFPFDNSLEIRTNRNSLLNISQQLASVILIKN